MNTRTIVWGAIDAALLASLVATVFIKAPPIFSFGILCFVAGIAFGMVVEFAMSKDN